MTKYFFFIFFWVSYALKGDTDLVRFEKQLIIAEFVADIFVDEHGQWNKLKSF